MATDTETAAEHGERTMHSLLIVEATRWLSRKGHTVVITDMTHAGPETADAIGWRGKWSTLVECKASRSDFLADKKKCFRRMPDLGMGNRRYFCAPAGIIKPEDLPEGWGLLERAVLCNKPPFLRPEGGNYAAINTDGFESRVCNRRPSTR